MSANQMTQLNRLMEELDILKNARQPEEAGREIRDYVDLQAGKDFLAGTCEFMNPWVPDKEQKGKKKVKN